MISHILAEGVRRARPRGAMAAACPHVPRCPAATAPGRDAARTVAAHPEQGWSLLCNGVVLFEDTGELLPGGQALPPRRARSGLLGQIAAA
jgi:Family of unknown function (DUF5999)